MAKFRLLYSGECIIEEETLERAEARLSAKLPGFFRIQNLKLTVKVKDEQSATTQ